MHEVLVNCLFKLAPENLWLGELTVAVDLGRKATKQRNKISSDMTVIFFFLKIYQIDILYQESIQSSTTPDPGYQWESDKLTFRHHKQEPRGQPFPSR